LDVSQQGALITSPWNTYREDLTSRVVAICAHHMHHQETHPFLSVSVAQAGRAIFRHTRHVTAPIRRSGLFAWPGTPLASVRSSHTRSGLTPVATAPQPAAAQRKDRRGQEPAKNEHGLVSVSAAPNLSGRRAGGARDDQPHPPREALPQSVVTTSAPCPALARSTDQVNRTGRPAAPRAATT